MNRTTSLCKRLLFIAIGFVLAWSCARSYGQRQIIRITPENCHSVDITDSRVSYDDPLDLLRPHSCIRADHSPSAYSRWVDTPSRRRSFENHCSAVSIAAAHGHVVCGDQVELVPVKSSTSPIGRDCKVRQRDLQRRVC